LVDYLISYGLLLVWFAMFGTPLQELEEPSQVSGQATVQVDSATIISAFIGILAVSLGWFVCKAVLVAYWGWTPGKLMLGLRVVRWDGRPPGLPRALLRSLVDTFGQGLLGYLYQLPALFFMMTTAGHRQIADYAADTFVIDAYYQGRLIIATGNKVIAGSKSVTKEERQQILAAAGAGEGGFKAPGGKITEPFYDKRLDTYVVFSPKRNDWMQFNKEAGVWEPIPPDRRPTQARDTNLGTAYD
jgi:uncharacterized RDD family membrane protein YckC